MKLIVTSSLLFVCSAVAAQDLPPAANSPLPASTLQEAPVSQRPALELPSTNRRQVYSTPSSELNAAPGISPGTIVNPRFVENPQPVGNSLPRAALGSPLGSAPNENVVEIRYMKKTPVQFQVARPDGSIETKTRMVFSEASAAIAIPHDDDFDKLDKTFEELEGDGKRAAIQAVTAHRHGKLLQALKDAKTEAEKEAAAKKLEANYRAHYASETKWRLDRLAELEKRMEEMRSQVKERAAAEEKFLEAAMTLAKLNAQGIAAEPPHLKASNSSYNQNPSYNQGEPLFGPDSDSPYPLNATPNAPSTFEPSRTTPLQ